jgi:hypothetical protein
MNLNDLKIEKKKDISSSYLFSGESGTRKTTAIASFPKPIYIFDVDLKIESLLNYFKGDAANDIDFDRYSPDDTIKLDRKFIELEKTCKYKTVALDGLTFVSMMSVQYGFTLRGGKGNMPFGNSPNSGVVDLNTMQDYMLESAYIKQILGYLKNIYNNHHVNVILTAHVRPVEQTYDKNGEVVKNAPTMTRMLMTAGRQIAPMIPASFNEVFHFNVKPAMSSSDKPQYIVRTQHNGLDYARTTLPLAETLNVTDKPLFEYIKESMEKE